ncbi:hypothetical protein D0T50_11535 [Bacteroides sp. 214]|uniref:tetratricopeptide repeat protein n=1 Tax=Bacteroides sp. 214 TaxID=2302935 RepID=UPI0013D35B19|nr:hypothetical protein [Bacteroides sp. 214]NDW13521.1 hypothetical protein [Bacteroides sp. 214]
MKKTLLPLLAILVSLPAFSQTIEEQEFDLRIINRGEKWGRKMDKAWKLLEADSLNFVAVSYIVEYYSKESKDSIRVFYNYLTQKHPKSAVPYLYRVELGRYENLSHSALIAYAEKGHRIDPKNKEITYTLGKNYYDSFNKEYNGERKKTNLDHYAENAVTYMEKLSENSCNNPNTWAMLIQLYNYQGKPHKVATLQEQKFCEELYFPLLAFSTVHNKDAFNFSPLPSGWETNYSIDILWATECSISRIEWYSKHLQAMKERMLCNNVDVDVIRFTWLRTFHNPIAVRLENNKGTITVYWKKADGAGGYEPGKLVVNKKKIISEADWQKVIQKLQTKKFWQMPAVDNEMGFDGSQWILEANISGKYHIVDRWCGGDIQDLCMMVFNLTGLKIKKDDLY